MIDIFTINKTKCLCTYENLGKTQASINLTVNIILGSFITSYARTYLYSILEQANSKGSLLYTDTDSCIVKHFHEEKIFQTGTFLGDLSSEIKESEIITSFISGGSKNYVLGILNTKTKIITYKIVVKGFSLNIMEQIECFTIDNLKNMIQNYENGKKIYTEIKNTKYFYRDPLRSEIYTQKNF